MKERTTFEFEITRLEVERESQVSRRIAKKTAEVIYVRGGSPRVPANLVWKYAHPRSSRANTALNLFDFSEMKHKRWNDWKGSLPPKGTPDKVDTINSVLDLYDFIKGANRGSVEELHFFTHGWAGGPILVNTFDLSGDDTKRDVNDKDPRIKDFRISTVLGGSEGLRFRQAFASDALVKLWGCYYEQPYRDKVREFYRVSKQKQDKIKEDYKKVIKEKTYQFVLHKTIGLPVYAAPVGWGTNPYLPVGIHGARARRVRTKYRGVWPPKKGDNWWRVSAFFRSDRGDDFYRQLGAKFDVLDYVAYMEEIVK